jgi:hypothetical protein
MPDWAGQIRHPHLMLRREMDLCQPWMRWRFSLRTLLIVKTLVAVVLGCMAWAVR